MSTRQDKTLGMDRKISRRDFIHGTSTLAAGGALASCPISGLTSTGNGANTLGSSPTATSPASSPLNKMPFFQDGLRGSHVGSFEIAHEMALQKRSDWSEIAHAHTDGQREKTYDLVVVGAGISGLSAAYFYQQQHPDAQILILENHDDFGGHAKRNEFDMGAGNPNIIGYGGSQSLEAPGAYSEVAVGLLNSLGVETKKLGEAYDQSFYKKHDLASSLFFNKATFGQDKLLRGGFLDVSGFLPMAEHAIDHDTYVEQMPISAAAKHELKQLLGDNTDKLPNQSIFSEPAFLESLTYKDLLTKHLGITEPEVINILQDLPSGYFGQGIDVITAIEALGFGLPGLNQTSLGSIEGVLRGILSVAQEPYIYHFPDGNASVARMLVRKLIPQSAPGNTMYDIVHAEFDYGALDNPTSNVALRLSSTVVNVEHDQDPQASKHVNIDYVRTAANGNQLRSTVKAKQVVLACYNMAIPYICPELPNPQKQALAQLVKLPLVYTNVVLKNWRAFKKLGIGMAACPGSWHQTAMLDFPVSMDGYQFSQSPDQPIVLHMNRAATVPGLPSHDQARAGRYALLNTSYESIEREIRSHLSGMLGGGGFDPSEDIQAITVNRWPHGYACEFRDIHDGEFAPGQAPHELGRKPFGRITIANSDAASRAYVDAAIDEAWRAVQELG